MKLREKSNKSVSSLAEWINASQRYVNPRENAELMDKVETGCGEIMLFDEERLDDGKNKALIETNFKMSMLRNSKEFTWYQVEDLENLLLPKQAAPGVKVGFCVVSKESSLKCV